MVLRGDRASGKSSVAAGIRDRFGRGLALVAQDNLRRIVLRERDRPGAANIGPLDTVARYALDVGYHVVVEGILYADRYGDMLARLPADHRGPAHGHYPDVPFDETLARHATKPIAGHVSEADLRDRYRQRELPPGGMADAPRAWETNSGIGVDEVGTGFGFCRWKRLGGRRRHRPDGDRHAGPGRRARRCADRPSPAVGHPASRPPG